MDKHNPIVLYFGMAAVERAVANYFAKHGVNQTVRERLLDMEANPGLFLEMVCEYVEKEA